MAECQLPKLNTGVRFPSPAPRRSKVRFAPTSFYARGKKDVIRPLPCSSFPTATRCAAVGGSAALRMRRTPCGCLCWASAWVRRPAGDIAVLRGRVISRVPAKTHAAAGPRGFFWGLYPCAGLPGVRRRPFGKGHPGNPRTAGPSGRRSRCGGPPRCWPWPAAPARPSGCPAAGPAP